MPEEIRPSLPGDEPRLCELWQTVFGDTEDYIGDFFERLYAPGMATVCVCDGRIVSAAYDIRLGDLTAGESRTPCRVIYAYGTDPAYRRRGFGGRVLRAALERRGEATAVCPAEPPLYGYYAGFGFRPFFSLCERRCTDVGSQLHGSVTRVTVRGYAALREELLGGRAHIDYDMPVLEYQEHLCRSSGGGLYYVVSEGTRCCAAVELTEDEALLKELIVPAGSQYNAAALAARAVRRERFTWRAPARPGDEALPHAMLTGPLQRPEPAPWFGFDFN